MTYKIKHWLWLVCREEIVEGACLKQRQQLQGCCNRSGNPDWNPIGWSLLPCPFYRWANQGSERLTYPVSWLGRGREVAWIGTQSVNLGHPAITSPASRAAVDQCFQFLPPSLGHVTLQYLLLEEVEYILQTIEVGFGHVTSHGWWAVRLYNCLCGWLVHLHFCQHHEIKIAGSHCLKRTKTYREDLDAAPLFPPSLEAGPAKFSHNSLNSRQPTDSRVEGACSKMLAHQGFGHVCYILLLQ